MCGILAYIGAKPARPILLEGLKRLEYRGYDSCGLALMDLQGDGEGAAAIEPEVRLIKTAGRIERLETKVAHLDGAATVGLAHTRWATHGPPTEENAHPHTDCRSEVFIIHNGIIENYQRLKEWLAARGHAFTSATDSEVIAHLVEEHFSGDLQEAVIKSLRRLEGTYGLAVMHTSAPDCIVIARKSSPMVIGVGEDELLAASDATALLRRTNRVIYLEDGEVATLNTRNFSIVNIDNQPVEWTEETIEWDLKAIDKGDYPHFMLKEIFEQPETVLNALRGRLVPEEGVSKLGGLEAVLDRLKETRQLIIVACGTSYHAGLIGRYLFERMTDLTVTVELASEFRYRKLSLQKNTTVLAISQSGETADTLAAVREAKRKGALVLGIVNVVGSSIARETPAGVYNHAGPEIGVASTKMYVSQLTVLTLIALLLGRFQGVSLSEGVEAIRALERLPEQIEAILERAEEIEELARRYVGYNHFLYLGRHFNYPTALEGALKLKEISYIHAEGYAAGEMKHGPIALIDEAFPSVCIAPRDSSYEKMMSNIEEICCRHGKVIAVATEGDEEIRRVADDVLYIPPTLEFLQPILAAVPLQLFAYYVARLRQCDIDMPRNLAKCVTVE